MPDKTELLVLSTQRISHQSHSCIDYNEPDRGKDKGNGNTRKSFIQSSGSDRSEGSDEGNSTGSETRRNRRREDNGESQTTKNTHEEMRRNKRREDRNNCYSPKGTSDNKYTRAKDFKEKKDAATQIELSDQENDRPTTKHRSTEVEEISFSLEKLKLIRMVLDFMSKPFGNITFDENRQTIAVRGTRDDIETVKIHLYEIANNALYDTVHIDEQTEEHALSASVESWLNKEFSNCQLPAVCCNIDDRSSILAKDEEALQSACRLLGDLLVTKKLDFDDSQGPYLRTLGWTEYVEDAESSRIVSIATEESSLVVMVTGYASDVSDCVRDLRDLLRANASMTHNMRCEARIVTLLKSQESAITAEICEVAR